MFARRVLTACALTLLAATSLAAQDDARALELEIRRVDLDGNFQPGPP
jgi:hypothetical protein